MSNADSAGPGRLEGANPPEAQRAGLGTPLRIFRDFLSSDEAEKLRRYFEKSSYVHRDQARKSLEDWSEELPGRKEIYTAKFWRCRDLEEEFGKWGWLQDRLRSALGCSKLDLRAHKMERGDHFRCHRDNRVGERGFTLTLSKGWKWDWGGILMVMGNEKPEAVLPRWNELAVIEGGPHWVTPVCEWALEPRYTLVGFG